MCGYSVEKILKNMILDYLTACHTPMFLRTKWNNKFEHYSIIEDKLKDIFILGALYGLIIKMATDFYDAPITDDVSIEIDTLVNEFMANNFE